MVVDDAIGSFDLLERQRGEIENELGAKLEWEENKVYLPKKDPDTWDKDDWENQHEWLMSKLELFDRVFRPRIQEINNSWQYMEVYSVDSLDIPINSDT